MSKIAYHLAVRAAAALAAFCNSEAVNITAPEPTPPFRFEKRKGPSPRSAHPKSKKGKRK